MLPFTLPFELAIAEVGLGAAPSGTSDDELAGPGRPAGPPACPRAGVVRLVERLTINLPCTTRLSVDFFKSLVSM